MTLKLTRGQKIIATTNKATLDLLEKTMTKPTLPKSLFCKCKNGTPCFDTMVEIEKWLANHDRELIGELKQKVAAVIVKNTKLTAKDLMDIMETIFAED